MALEKLRQQARTIRPQEERDAKFWAALKAKLAEENVKVPSNLNEDAVAWGRCLAAAYRLNAKWGESVPPAGTPEASAYQKVKEELMTDTAAWVQFGADPNATASLFESDRYVQFQALALSTALNLNEDQTQQADAALSAYMEDAAARGPARVPSPYGDAAWWQAHIETQQRTIAAINAFLSPEQSAVFTDIQGAIVGVVSGPPAITLPQGGLMPPVVGR